MEDNEANLVHENGSFGEDDEGDFSLNNALEEGDYFDLIIGRLEDILIDSNFQKLQTDFLDKYCSEFDDTEENKLSYMDIFDEYVTTIEKNIEDRLKLQIPEFSMDRFQRELEENRDSLDGEVFEMLYTLSDFVAFKSLMLDFKAEKEGKNEDFASTLTVTPLRM